MQVELTIMFEDIEKYNRGDEVIATARGRAASLILENFKMNEVMDISVDASEVIRKEEKVLSGMSPGRYPYYVIRKKILKVDIPELVISTPVGEIAVNKASDPNYPGVFISTAGVDLVCVEYDKSVGKHVVRVWDYHDPDNDPVYKQVIPKQ